MNSSFTPSWLFHSNTIPTRFREVILVASNNELDTWKTKFHELEQEHSHDDEKKSKTEKRSLLNELQPFFAELEREPTHRVYIPKYNTFKREKNEDYHLEIGDEAFDQATLSLNQIRSRLLAKKLQLTPETLVSIFSEETKPEYIHLTKQWLSKHATQDESFFTLLKTHPALYNCSHLTAWSQEQQVDIMRQLWGEQETITLTTESVLQESLYHLQQWYQKERRKPTENVGQKEEFPSNPKDQAFVDRYLYYLSLIDQWLFDSHTKTVEPFLANYLEKTPPSTTKKLSLAMIGYLIQNYFIPWKFTNYMQLHTQKLKKLVQPWKVIQENGITDELLFARLQKYHQQIYSNKKNVLFGKHLFFNNSVKEEAMKEHIKELERAVGKKQNFYKNEKKRFLLSTSQSELEAIQNYLQQYTWKLIMMQRVNQFFKERVLPVVASADDSILHKNRK